MQYPFVPISQRGRLVWPDGKRLALIITLNLEYWDLVKDTTEPYYAGGPSILPDPVPGNIPDFPNYSWREYGQRVGIWRMLREFDRAGVPASCTMNARMGQERRAVIDAVLERGWELVAHNVEQGDLLFRYAHDPERERALIEKSLEIFRQVTGRPAKGWLSSSLRGTLRTPEILVEHGCTFFCDLMNDDQPYLIHTPKGPIVATPYSIEVNDFTFFQRRGLGNEAALELLKTQFDVLYEEAAETGMMMNIGLHPHVAGVPHRIGVLRDFLEYAKSFDGVWWATREAVAECYKAQAEQHIPTAAPRGAA